MKVLILVTVFLFSFAIASNPLRVNHQARQISSDVFSCDSPKPIVQAICKVALERVNSELQAAGISIRRSGVLFSIDDPKDEKINTGHSCSVTAQARHKFFSAHFSSDADLNLSGNSLTEPLAVRLFLPVSVNARIDIKQRFGARIFGRCSKYGSDSYSLKGGVSSNVNLVVGLTLAPSLGTTPSGDYALVLKPAVAVLFELNKLDFDFRTSGVSPLSSAVTFVSGFISTNTKVIKTLFKGDSVSTVVRERLLFDVGVPILLGIGGLPGILEDAVWSVLSKIGEHFARKDAEGYGRDLETELNEKVRRALKTDSDGTRTIIIPKEIVELIQAGKSADSLLSDAPSDPSIACMKEVGLLCSQCRGCSECSRRAFECQRKKAEYVRLYKPSSLVAATPKIALKTPTPPTPTPSPAGLPSYPKTRAACMRHADDVCEVCHGCANCQKLQMVCRSLPTSSSPSRRTPPPNKRRTGQIP